MEVHAPVVASGSSSVLTLSLQNLSQDTCISSTGSQETLLRRPHTPVRAASPITTTSRATIKHNHNEPPAYTSTSFFDVPSSPCYESSPTSSDQPCSQTQQLPLVFHIVAPGDCTNTQPASSSQPSYPEDDPDDEIPLPHLFLYPRDAPPAYSAVVRQSCREALLQHVARPVVVDFDEEAAMEMICADDVRFSVERAVATAVVMGLLILAGLLVGMLFLWR